MRYNGALYMEADNPMSYKSLFCGSFLRWHRACKGSHTVRTTSCGPIKHPIDGSHRLSAAETANEGETHETCDSDY